MRKVKVLTLLVALSIAMPVLSAERSLLELAPKDSLLVLRLKDMASQWDQFKATGVYQRLDHSALMKTVRENPDYQAFTDKLATWPGGPITPIELALDFLGRDAVLAVRKLPEGGHDGVVLLRSPSADVLRRDIELLDSLDDKKDVSPADETETYKDITILKRAREKKGKMKTTLRAVVGDLLILSENANLVKAAIDRHLGASEGGIATDERFKAAMARLPNKANPITIYLDIKAALSELETKLKTAPQKPRANLLRLWASMARAFDTASAAINFEEGVILTGTASPLKGREMDKLLAAFKTTGSVAAPKRLPAGTTVAAATARLNAKALWTALTTHLAPAKRAQAEKFVALANGVLGMADKTPAEGVLDILGPEVCLAAIKIPPPPGAAIAPPALVALVEYKGGRDMAMRLDAIASAFFTVAGATEANKLRPAFAYAPERMGDVLIHRARLTKLPLRNWLAPSMAVTDDFVILSTSTEGIKAVLSTVKGKSAPLTADKNFTGQGAHLRRPSSGLFYLDVGRAVDLLVRHKALLLAVDKKVVSGAKTYEKAQEEFDTFIELLRIVKSFGSSGVLDETGVQRILRIIVDTSKPVPVEAK